MLARGWLEEQDELNNIDDILEVGGRLVCRNCTIRNCDCKVRKYQVSNVQGFLVAVSQTKYIYNLNEEGLKYL